MSYPVMNDYLKLIKKNINDYMKIILEHKYNKSICDDFIDMYIDIMYYDTYMLTKKNKQKDEMRKKIDDMYNKLISSNFNSDKLKQIDITYDFFENITMLENSYEKNEIYEKTENIDNLRREKLHKEEQEYKEILIEKIKENIKNRKKFLNKYESKEFYLENKKLSNNLYKIDLKYNIKFPMIYSENAINKVLKDDIINEDRLFIEYIMISVQIINDIENLKYNQNYLVNFAESLFEKKHKLNRLLEIINNSVIQDRVSLLINYETFINYKEDIYELIKLGFKIAIKLDYTFKFEILELKILTLFSYVLINKKLECYMEILKNKHILENIIEI